MTDLLLVCDEVSLWTLWIFSAVKVEARHISELNGWLTFIIQPAELKCESVSERVCKV